MAGPYHSTHSSFYCCHRERERDGNPNHESNGRVRILLLPMAKREPRNLQLQGYPIAQGQGKDAWLDARDGGKSALSDKPAKYKGKFLGTFL